MNHEVRYLAEPLSVAWREDDKGRTAVVEGYAARYREPKERDDRVVIEIAVERILGRA